jgi:hypothetical protein
MRADTCDVRRGSFLAGCRATRIGAMASMCFALLATVAHAQTTVNSTAQQIPSSAGSGSGSATAMWGVGPGAGNTSQPGVDSATMHESLANSAAFVNSAKRGFLYSSGTSIVYEAIGSQSIVNASIYGNNNIADISANQTSTNNGNVNANGSISLGGNGSSSSGGAAAPSAVSGNSNSSASGGNGKTAHSSQTNVQGTGNQVQAGATTIGTTTVGTPSSTDQNLPANSSTVAAAGGG